MRLRTLVVVGLVGFASIAANKALANDTTSLRTNTAAMDGVSFADPGRTAPDGGPALIISLDASPAPRTAQIAAEARSLTPQNGDDLRRYELALAQRGFAGLPVDVEFAQRASFGVDGNGDVSHAGSGSELRLGRGLGDLHKRASSSWDRPTWYIFAAADDEALTWQPGARSAFGGSGSSFSLEDRVEIGDMQAGVTVEAGRLQASFAYVEREVSARIGAESRSRDESFTGFTLTLRH